MSTFSNNVKAELCEALTDKDKAFACLYAMLLFSRQSESTLCFSSTNPLVAALFLRLTNIVFRGKITPRFDGERLCEITDEKQVGLMRDKYPFLKAPDTFSFSALGKIRADAFFAGVFLTSAGVSNPTKEYHLEFFPPSPALCAELANALNARGIAAKTRGTLSVYIKDSEGIEDTLALIGAGMSALEIMNAKIEKDFINRANRVRNCDYANIDKTVEAASRQIEAINKIKASMGFESLPPPLRELAELRVDNPQSSLSELGELLSPPITRSGVNRRLQKLEKLAQSL